VVYYFICKNEIIIKNTVKNMTTNKTITDYEEFLLNFLQFYFKLNKNIVSIYVVTEECLYDSEFSLYSENGQYEGVYRDFIGCFLSDIDAILFLTKKKNEDKNDNYRYTIKKVDLERRSYEDNKYKIVLIKDMHPSYSSITIESIAKYIEKNKMNIRTLTI